MSSISPVARTFITKYYTNLDNPEALATFYSNESTYSRGDSELQAIETIVGQEVNNLQNNNNFIIHKY